MSGPEAVLDDMREEGAALDRLVADLEPARWALATPAPGWTIAHQIAHLAWTDRAALRAANDPDTFRAQTERHLAEPDPMAFIDAAAEEGARTPPAELLAEWRAARAELGRVLAALPPGARTPWFGMPMSAAGSATARIMEMWAHGEDIAEALGVRRTPTARLRHVVRIGVRARDYAYVMNGLEAPAEPFRVEITGPGGELWAHGPEDAPQRVTGDAVDFCRLVTQRTHVSDTAVRAEGDEAARWLTIAQAFAGPPGAGRAPTASGERGPRSGGAA